MNRTWWAIVFAIMLSVAGSGCSGDGAAARRLENQAPQLVRNYITGLLNRQIASNQDVPFQFFALPGDVLLIAEVGMPQFTEEKSRYEDLREFRMVKSYVVTELHYEVLDVKIGEVRAYRDPRFSHRSSLSIKLRRIQKIWAPGSGIPIYGVIPATKVPEAGLAAYAEKNLSKFLPPPEVDYPYLLQTTAQESSIDSAAILVIGYDPAIRQWIPEEPGDAGSPILNASKANWLATRPEYHPAGTVILNRRLYPAADAEWLKKYDQGLVWFRQEWVPREAVKEYQTLGDAMAKFQTESISLESMAVFLKLLAQCRHAPNRGRALTLARKQGVALIHHLSNDNDLDGLKKMGLLLMEDSDWGELRDNLAAARNGAENAVTARYNLLLDEQQRRIRRMETDLQQVNDQDMPMTRVDIVTGRVAHSVEKDCPEEAAELKRNLLIFSLAYALDHNDIDYVDQAYRNSVTAAAVKSLEGQLIALCTECRNGWTPCPDCTDGKCSNCHGTGMVGSEICPACKGHGTCSTCHGKGQVKCLACEGRGFITRRTSVKKLRASSWETIRHLLHQNLEALESRKLREQSINKIGSLASQQSRSACADARRYFEVWVENWCVSLVPDDLIFPAKGDVPVHKSLSTNKRKRSDLRRTTIHLSKKIVDTSSIPDFFNCATAYPALFHSIPIIVDKL